MEVSGHQHVRMNVHRMARKCVAENCQEDFVVSGATKDVRSVIPAMNNVLRESSDL
jgi:hypothetical protein